jgi:hypothetical protein
LKPVKRLGGLAKDGGAAPIETGKTAGPDLPEVGEWHRLKRVKRLDAVADQRSGAD